MLNKRLYYQQHPFPFPPPLYRRLPAQPSLGASRAAFCCSPEAAAPPNFVAWWLTAVQWAHRCQTWHRWQGWVLHASHHPQLHGAGLLPQVLRSHTLILYLYVPCFFSTFSSTDTLQEAEPEPISTASFITKADRLFHCLHTACLRTTSRTCLRYKFPSFLPALERGDAKRGCTPGEDVCFGNRLVIFICRTWQVEPPRPACIGKAWRRHYCFVNIT